MAVTTAGAAFYSAKLRQGLGLGGLASRGGPEQYTGAVFSENFDPGLLLSLGSFTFVPDPPSFFLSSVLVLRISVFYQFSSVLSRFYLSSFSVQSKFCTNFVSILPRFLFIFKNLSGFVVENGFVILAT